MLFRVLAAFFFASECQALVARSTLPPSFDAGSLVRTAASLTANIFRDGGGGGTVGGNNIMIFCDTTTTNGGENGQMIGFTSNTITYVCVSTRGPVGADGQYSRIRTIR